MIQWTAYGIHCNTWTFPTSFTSTNIVIPGILWIDGFAAQENTLTVASISIVCAQRHCMGNYRGMFAIGY